MAGKTSNNEKLLKLSFWSKMYSWVILTLYSLNFLIRISIMLQAQSDDADIGNPFLGFSLEQLWQWTNLLMTPAAGIMFFLILQSISKGIIIFVDIKENS